MKTNLLICVFFLLSCEKKFEEPLPKADNNLSEQISYGKDLILHTSKYFGPKGTLAQNSNGMNCTNCHLQGGTVFYGNNYEAVFANYPKFRERSGKVENLEKRINDCFQRSLNGDSLQKNSKEMLAMISYINSVGKNIPKNTVPEGSGIKKLALLKVAANPALGKIVYEKTCFECHGNNGEGKLSTYSSDYFEFPPLWGNSSYNVSAGLNRIQHLAGFIYTNMPNKIATADKPLLTEEEAWNVAAYIISKPRPQKFFKEDWPNLKTKPVDYSLKAFADNFSEEQHRYGPFQPILDWRKNH